LQSGRLSSHANEQEEVAGRLQPVSKLCIMMVCVLEGAWAAAFFDWFVDVQ